MYVAGIDLSNKHFMYAAGDTSKHNNKLLKI